MKKALSTAVVLSLAFGFFSCEHQGGKMPARKAPMQHNKKTERTHPRRNMVSQQSVEKAAPTQEVQ